MNPIPGTEGHPPWMQLVGALAFVVTMGILAGWSAWKGQQKGKQTASDAQSSAETLAQRATAVVAMSPTSDRLTQDALVQTLSAIRETLVHNNAMLERIGDLLEEDAQREKAEAQKEEFMRIVRDELRRNAEAQGVTLVGGGEGGPRDR
ncbi:hypothetical protein [Antarcticirhabdus aurantiaca]|uniref:Uncharacterized protein n=1 Tax=Antarcticirhabdus aurantiaca TaxID=2606717 RepID=A0ACD4NKQ9_9HYPH|nr:hypothetical protein OXU80_22175 [Jeongeuplla avenae]